MKIDNKLSIALLVLSIVCLIYGVGFSKHSVISQSSANADSNGAIKMSEPQLMEQMCYDGIILDKDGNLAIKARDKACST